MMLIKELNYLMCAWLPLPAPNQATHHADAGWQATAWQIMPNLTASGNFILDCRSENKVSLGFVEGLNMEDGESVGLIDDRIQRLPHIVRFVSAWRY